MPTFHHDGIKINYEQSGSGREHLTLLHGIGSNLGAWDYIASRLETTYRVLRPDMRGHGLSDKLPGPYSLDDFVEDLRALLDHCDVEKTTLVGFSFGGMIAQKCAITDPDRLNKVAILSAVAGRTPAERATLIKRAEDLEAGGSMVTVDAAVDRWFSPEFREANPDIVEQQRQRILSNDPVSYAAAYRVFAEEDLIDELHQIKHRCLIATGENDPGSSPRMARMMHERIKDSRLHIWPRLRHSVLVEAPDEVVDLLIDFLQE